MSEPYQLPVASMYFHTKPRQTLIVAACYTRYIMIYYKKML